MMPCKLCSPDADKGVPPLDADGKLLRGLKQVTKTKRSDVTWSNKYGEMTCPRRARGALVPLPRPAVRSGAFSSTRSRRSRAWIPCWCRCRVAKVASKRGAATGKGRSASKAAPPKSPKRASEAPEVDAAALAARATELAHAFHAKLQDRDPELARELLVVLKAHAAVMAALFVNEVAELWRDLE